jgi:hypothetical protein
MIPVCQARTLGGSGGGASAAAAAQAATRRKAVQARRSATFVAASPVAPRCWGERA